MLLKIGISEVVVVAHATCYMLLPPQKNCAKTKCKWHRPWCGDDTSRLGWGVGMHQAMVWAKAAHHHGASGITFSSATGVNFFYPKSIVEVWYIYM